MEIYWRVIKLIDRIGNKIISYAYPMILIDCVYCHIYTRREHGSRGKSICSFGYTYVCVCVCVCGEKVKIHVVLYITIPMCRLFKMVKCIPNRLIATNYKENLQEMYLSK